MFFSLLMWKLKRPLFYSKMCLCQFLFLNKLEMQSCGKYSGVKAISHNIEVQWNSDWQVSICEQQQQQQGGSMPRSITDAPHIYKLKCVSGGLTYTLAVAVGFTRAAKQLSPQQVAVILQEGQIQVAEKLHVLVFHSQLLWRVPVDHLESEKISASYRHCELQCWDSRSGVPKLTNVKAVIIPHDYDSKNIEQKNARSRWGRREPHLEVRHVFVALLRAGVVRQLHVPEAGQLVDQEGVLFDHRIEDVLRTHTHITSKLKY